MEKEITKTSWSKFFRDFNATNQFRQANISIIDKRKSSDGVASNLTFLGMGMEKKGRNIEGVQFFAGRWDPEKIVEPILSVKEPVKIILQKSQNGQDQMVRVQAKDGSEARIELFGENRPEPLVEKVAYTIYERRGRSDGNDQGDWFQAERIVKETEKQLTR